MKEGEEWGLVKYIVWHGLWPGVVALNGAIVDASFVTTSLSTLTNTKGRNPPAKNNTERLSIRVNEPEESC